HDVKLLRAAAGRPTALRARRDFRQDEIGGPVPADRPQGGGAGLGEDLYVVRAAVQVFDVKDGRGAARVVSVLDHGDPLVVGADREHAADRGARRHVRRDTRHAVGRQEVDVALLVEEVGTAVARGPRRAQGGAGGG